MTIPICEPCGQILFELPITIDNNALRRVIRNRLCSGCQFRIKYYLMKDHLKHRPR